MKRIMLLTIAALTLAGGSAMADHWRGGGRGGWRGGGEVRVRVSPPAVRYNSSVYVRPTYYHQHYYRQPIYMPRPLIRHRYFNYYVRPQVVVEDYPVRDGYYWVNGAWQWNGAEWIWMPGHYEPNAAYNYDYDGDGY